MELDSIDIHVYPAGQQTERGFIGRFFLMDYMTLNELKISSELADVLLRVKRPIGGDKWILVATVKGEDYTIRPVNKQRRREWVHIDGVVVSLARAFPNLKKTFGILTVELPKTLAG